MTPNEAEKYIKTTTEVHLGKVKHLKKKNKFKVGDKVRFKLLKGVLEKGYTRTYSKEVFTIEKIEANYTLSNGQTYRADRLQKVLKIDTTPDEPTQTPVKEVVEKVPLDEEEKKAQIRRRVKSL